MGCAFQRASNQRMLKPIELEIELFCRGMRIGDSCHTGEDGRRISRTRAGLGSGLEIIIPAAPKPIWVNVPVVEPFALSSVFTLRQCDGRYFVVDSRNKDAVEVTIPPEPAWYSRNTSADVSMSRVGVLQGNYLGIYISNRCLYWSWSPSLACKFCTTGKNVGAAEESRKRVTDVVEVALAARDESNCIFTHFNTGYHYEDRADREVIHGLRQAEPFVRAVRTHVGGFIGVQAGPGPRGRHFQNDEIIAPGPGPL